MKVMRSTTKLLLNILKKHSRSARMYVNPIMTGVHRMDICTLCRLRLMPENSLNDHVVFIHWLHWNIVKAENHRKFVDPDQTPRSYQGLHFAKADYDLYCLSSSVLWAQGITELRIFGMLVVLYTFNFYLTDKTVAGEGPHEKYRWKAVKVFSESLIGPTVYVAKLLKLRRLAECLRETLL